MKHYLCNMISIIQNGLINKTTYVLQKEKRVCKNLLLVLWDECYILGFKTIVINNYTYYKIFLKYKNGNSVIRKIKLISKPGNKIYYTIKQLWKLNYTTGLIVVSTNKGLLSATNCKKKKLGGEAILIVE